ncbi:sphingosine hydroxylase [Phanerochaete sordida]|uniref:Sphingosine hydroxylase n=1 Tax=Phanerochaete sordida TaxID=48140 RepID=A0A9P3G878_9APHY|nr:sphingosine hydroxylase [Phanerochaete sordida]
MNFTDPALSLLSKAQVNYLAEAKPIYYVARPSLLTWMPDNIFSLAAPVIAYWAASAFFHILDMSEWKALESYRIHDSEEVKSRNLATRWDVFKAVVLQHVIQTAIGLWWMEDKPAGDLVDHVAGMGRKAPALLSILRTVLGDHSGMSVWITHGHGMLYFVYWWAIPFAKFMFGMFLIDTWEYFLHRAMHLNTYLYKTLHSVHHRLYVPYAFGALYNHPLEGFLLDSVGAAIAEAVSFMSTREAILLFVVSTLKTVDDHCGYRFPWDPLQMFCENNADYHDIHHQIIGIKSNFAQPFFVHWDVLLGTRMTRKDIENRRKKMSQKTE